MNPELWGGIECTVNRVGAHAFDQLQRSGHDRRPDDLDRIAELELKTLRYPILWERVQPDGPGQFDWKWSDERMSRLQELRIRPIVGLLHHGSGPKWTNLLDPEFPRKFARFAQAVARRYAWVDAYTPINEPLTTARFSGLYGHWFPHAKDDLSFVRCLLNQVEGVARAMEVIRAVHPGAELVQTEDLGKTFATELLQYQATFENERRWITYDLLSGHFVAGHPLWNFVLSTGVGRRQIDFLRNHPCPPDICGINYYVTSERFLDEEVEKYPMETRGGNFFHRYADVAAVRARPEGMLGIAALLRETWDRYHLPLAVTEVHLGCTREEQIRWLLEVWRECRAVATKGVDCRAVTAWALFGAFDWNSLVREQNGDYEPGAFDVRSPKPRATAIANVIRALAQKKNFFSPARQAPGWWHRPERLPKQLRVANETIHSPPGPSLLVLGGRGNLGQALGRIGESRGLHCQLLSRYEADVCDAESVRRAVENHRPWAVINASGYTLVDEAESDADPCFEVNGRGAAIAAQVCGEAGLPFVTFSSDLVFDGAKGRPYGEMDATAPLSIFGRSKANGEKEVALCYPDSLIVRTAGFFSPWNMSHFPGEILSGQGELVVPDSRVSPTYLPDLCHAVLDLLMDGASGIWHLVNEGDITWQAFAEILGHRFERPLDHLRVARPGELAAERPAYSVLTSDRASLMPSLEHALARFYHEFAGTFERSRRVGVDEPVESAPLR